MVQRNVCLRTDKGFPRVALSLHSFRTPLSPLSEMDSKAKNALEGLASHFPAFKPILESLLSLYQKRHWHQITQQILDLSSSACQANAQPLLMPLLEEFVIPFVCTQMNPVEFSRIAIAASESISSAGERIVFLNERVAEAMNLETKDKNAFLNCKCQVLRLFLSVKEQAKAHETLLTCKRVFEELDTSIDTAIKRLYFKATCEYDKYTFDCNSFYFSCLQYLSSTPLEGISLAERVEIAHDLCVAALLGSKIFHFGELLLNPVLNALQTNGGANAALLPLIAAFNAGRVEEFQAFSAFIQGHSVLGKHVEWLVKKVSLMALLELSFTRIGSAGRSVTFGEIAAFARIPVEEVECLTMQAMSLGLLEGKIDQTRGILLVEAVQPRVLDKRQIGALAESILAFKLQVAQAVSKLQMESHELLAHFPAK